MYVVPDLRLSRTAPSALQGPSEAFLIQKSWLYRTAMPPPQVKVRTAADAGSLPGTGRIPFARFKA